ncbi:MAG TPA: hypothetical protein VGE30_04115 [Candidatus Saccharimonadales bacterium]
MTKQEVAKLKRNIPPHAAIALGALTAPAFAVAYLTGVNMASDDLRQESVSAQIDGKKRQATTLELQAHQKEAYYDSAAEPFMVGSLAVGTAVFIVGEAGMQWAARRRQDHVPAAPVVDPMMLTVEQRFFPEYVAGNQDRTLQAV